MASPGETFPQQFALTILQLRQQKQQRDAELAEMRADRAARNFLEEQRMDLAERAQFQQNALQGGELDLRRMQFQAGLQQESKAMDIKAQLEADKIKAERESIAVKAFEDFNRNGTAFLPLSDAKDIGKFKDNLAADGSGFKVAHIEVPGQGIILQRIGGPGYERELLELQKTEAELEGIKQKRALDYANEQLIRERSETEQTKRAKLIGGVSVRDFEAARSALETYRKISSNTMLALSAKQDPASRTKAAELERDWKSYFRDEEAAVKEKTKPGEKKPTTTIDRIRDLEAVIDAYNASILNGSPPPTATNPDALRAAGVDRTFYEALGEQAQPPEKIVGRVMGGVRGFGANRTASEAFLVTESGRRIAVSPQEAEAQQLGQPYTPAPPPQVAPPAAAGPQSSAPAGPSAADQADAIDAANKILEEVIQKKRPPNDPEALRAAAFLSQQ